MDDLRWLSLSVLGANVILAIAVFIISRPKADSGQPVGVAALGVRIVASLAVINSLLVAFAMLTGLLYETSAVWTARDVINLLGPAFLFLFLAIRAWEFNASALGWSMIHLGTGVFVFNAMNIYWLRICQLADDPKFCDSPQSFVISALLGTCALMIAIVAIRRFARPFARVLRGECFRCGYSLRGTAGLRCPECGRELTLQELAICRSRLIPGDVMPVP